MDQHVKRKLENELMVLGLAQLKDPALIQQFAALINNWRGDRHEFLMGAINECDPALRAEMYEAIKPHLNFKPLPLQAIEAHIAERAGAMVSQRKMRVEGEEPRPINIGNQTFVKVPRPLSTGAVATLKCYRCNKVERFPADTPAGAMVLGRKAGWTREPGVNKEVCADCKVKEIASEQVVLSRKEVIIVTDKRRVN